ncbi:MAG: class I tRNA ligase family protein [Candidatus Paceibacterota bacterium]
MAEFNFNDKEKRVLDFWEERKIFEKSLALRQSSPRVGDAPLREQAKGKRFVFFEGPPTANGLPHIGHFLTRIYKDLYGRYKTMRGYFVLRKAGWDTHGLPVEIEVEKELGFKNKKDIEQYGIGKFNKKAKESVWKYKNEWEQMTKRMGFWLDMSDPYITYKNQYIESLWAIIKKIWDKNLLYLAHRVVPFCTRCGTPLSSHEVAQGYKTITDRSVFIKFKLKPNNKFPENTYILAWTTTPWTLPGNAALAIGKNIDYINKKVGPEHYLVAKDRAVSVLMGDEYIKEVKPNEDTFKGLELIGLEYEPLFEIEKLKSEKSYKIYDADFVSTSEGTGVVHTAVMYGEDDYNLGTKIGLPKFHTVDEQGKFVNVGQDLDGMYVKNKETEDKIIGILQVNGNLLKTEDYEHDYPFCWRCDTPLIYYAKESWFIKMSAVNKDLLKNNGKINWVPEHIKEGRFGQWIKEGKDWAFSRERYWGTPLPIWVCTQIGKNQKSKIKNQNLGCGNVFVAGSLEDLDKNRYKPKNEFYVLRHGHSTKNGMSGQPGIISSVLEKDQYPLTESGREQIRKVALKLKKAGGVDMIITSPFKRTKETAEIIADDLGIKVHIEPRIAEFRHSLICEGKDHHVCGLEKESRRIWDKKYGDEESWKELRGRMSQFLRDINSKQEGKKTLLVSHGDPIWLLETFTLGLSAEDTPATREDLYPQEGDLKKLNLKNWPYDEDGELDMHRPYIDEIILKCKKCGGKMKKVPDLIDVWFDSGAMPYAQWHWPFKEPRAKSQEPSNKKMFKEQFPADFIVEAVDQTRGWFYTLLAISTLLGKGIPYKNVMVLGHALDEKGVKMSKKLKNFVPVMELIDKYGTDVLRWYFCSSMSAGESKSVIAKEIEDKQKGFLGTLGNCLRFYELYASEAMSHEPGAMSLLDQWIMSRLNNVIKEMTDGLDSYDVTKSARALEKFVTEDFSNWWLRRSRKRKDSLELLRYLLLEISKLVAPFIPFTAEEMHQKLRDKSQETRTLDPKLSTLESVHLHDWPLFNKKYINSNLEKQMEDVRGLIAEGLAVRKSNQIKVRQPLRTVSVGLSSEFPAGLEELIKEELNVKGIVYDRSQKEKVILDTELDQALIYEGYARELMRQIQDMRKEAKYRLDEKVFGQWHSDDGELSEAIKKWEEEIKKETLLKEFLNSPHDDKVYDVEKEFEVSSGKKIWLGIKK